MHRLNDLGCVITHVAHETSQEGFYAEWRVVSVLTLEGDLVNRGEVFDEADLDAALARFDELQPQAPRLENAAIRVWGRFQTYLEADDWVEMAKMATEDIITDDRRRVIGAGLQRGRDVNVANIRASHAIGIKNVRSTVIATRGEHLVLDRLVFSGQDPTPEPFGTELLRVLEIDQDERIAAGVFFDTNDLDAAIAELDARYLTGEAAPHAQTWSVIAGSYAGFDRRELSATTLDFEDIDHRRGAGFAPGDMIAYLQASWADAPDTKIYIAAVHRLSNIGAVVTHVAHGVSHEGFDAEWRDIHLLTVEDDMFSRCELFDAADLDAALARFEELTAPARQLENVATRVQTASMPTSRPTTGRRSPRFWPTEFCIQPITVGS